MVTDTVLGTYGMTQPGALHSETRSLWGPGRW